MSAMASAERSATREDVWKACIICRTYQPRNGKLLSCLHVVCAGCLDECTSRDGSVSCLLCKSNTSAKVVGVELAKQLAESFEFLYGDEVPKVEMVSACDVGTGTASADIAFCDPCIDIDIEKEASHECADCECLPLCESHAEKHPKKRTSAGHRIHVRAGRLLPSQRTSSSASKRCMYHSKCNVVTYCQTCSQCICLECISSCSHEEHVMISIASAAAKQRTRVAEVFRAAGLSLMMTNDIIDTTASPADVTTATTTTPMDPPVNAAVTNTTTDVATTATDIMPIGELLAVTEKNIATVTEEASVASKKATERFDKIEKMVKQQRERILIDIHHRLWTHFDPLEAKKSRLESLLQRQAAVVKVATRLSSPSVCPQGALQVADTVVHNVLSVSKDLQAEQTIESPDLLFAELATLDGIQAKVEQFVRVCDGVRMDISKSIVEVPDPELQVGREGCVVVKLADSNGHRMPSDQPTPDIVPAIILPSGRKQVVQVSSQESDSSKLVIPISAAECGTITLELSSHGVSFRSRVHVSCDIFFDPHKCHGGTVLSSNNRVVTRSPEGPQHVYCHAVATEGYTNGRHEWAVRVVKGAVRNKAVAIGVTSAPSDCNYNSDGDDFFKKTTGLRLWSTHGSALKYQPTFPFITWFKSADMQIVLDGDVLVFTLDCDALTLQCLNQDTQEAAKFTDIDCSRPLYPAVFMYRKGQSVEILPQY